MKQSLKKKSVPVPNTKKHSPLKRIISGFTIVELLVAIVIISILATITLVSYRNISQKAIDAVVIADLDSAFKKFKLFQIENSGYPTNNGVQTDISRITDCPTPAAGNICLRLSNGNTFGTFQVDNSATPQTFCLTIKNSSNTKKYITQDGAPIDGVCTFAFAGTLTATTFSRSQINLSWGAVSGASNYTIERDTNPAFTAPVSVYTGSGLSASSTGLLSSTTYYYRINALVDGDTSLWSSAATATTADFAAPTGLAVASKTTTSISLSWNSVAGATGYMLQRSSTSDFASHIDISTGSGTTTATSSGLSAGSYYFRVNVTDSGGTSIWSGSITGSTLLTQTYTTPGSYSWTVPANITSVKLETWGAQGQNGFPEFYSPTVGSGGLGGYSVGNLAVTPGNTIYVNVGSVGSGGSGGVGNNSYTYATDYGNGGNGGGASDVRFGGNALTNRKIVAGGGGGGSGSSYDTDYANAFAGAPGGGGGGTNGSTAGGNGGTQTTGYSLGLGGPGTNGPGAGGGGNGYYGGYGAGDNSGGGGGSGYIGGVTGGSMFNSIQSGNGKVVISY